MARVLLPLMSVEASGLVGGLQYQNRRSGPSVGRRSVTSPRATRRRLLFRTYVAHAGLFWRRMSAPARQPIIDAAGGPRDAWSLFAKAFVRSKMLNLPLMTTLGLPPDRSVPPSLTLHYFPGATSYARATWSYFFSPYDYAVLYGYASYNNIAPPHPAKWKLLGSSPSIAGMVNKPFGASGQHIWLEVRWYDPRFATFLGSIRKHFVNP